MTSGTCLAGLLERLHGKHNAPWCTKTKRRLCLIANEIRCQRCDASARLHVLAVRGYCVALPSESVECLYMSFFTMHLSRIGIMKLAQFVSHSCGISQFTSWSISLLVRYNAPPRASFALPSSLQQSARHADQLQQGVRRADGRPAGGRQRPSLGRSLASWGELEPRQDHRGGREAPAHRGAQREWTRVGDTAVCETRLIAPLPKNTRWTFACMHDR